MIQRLLIPLEQGALGEHAFAVGIDLARQLGAQFIGLVIEPFSAAPRSDLSLQRHARDVLAPLERQAAAAGVPFCGVVSQASDIAEAIVAEAVEQRADLIVMATHGRGLVGEFLWGANTRRVMARTHLPVMVLRPPIAARQQPAPRGSAEAALARDGAALQ